jgi:predicted transcriptional regulator
MPRRPPSRITVKSLDTLWRVWAVLTITPQASTRESARQVGRSASVVHVALRRLVAAGFIEQPYRGRNARRVVVPCYQTGRMLWVAM